MTIYFPKGAAAEYSRLAANPYDGCGFGCLYCYVKTMPFISDSKKDRIAGAVPKHGFLASLEKSAAQFQRHGVTGQIFFTFMSDMYAPGSSAEITRRCYEIVKSRGFGINVLTKGGTLALRDLDLFDPKRDCFGATITTLDYNRSKAWEPGAPGPASSTAALREFHDAGVFTWVSIEPACSTKETLDIIQWTHDFVDLYKIGKTNHVKSDIDWQSYTSQVTSLCQSIGVKHYVKKPLQKYLPVGYPNEMYPVQHS